MHGENLKSSLHKTEDDEDDVSKHLKASRG
jgi:hypothetical protein